MDLCIVCLKSKDIGIVDDFLFACGLNGELHTIQHEDGDDIFDIISHQKMIYLTASDWIITLLDPEFCFNESFTLTLSNFSKNINIFYALSQDVTGGLWFEYHQQGELKRQWIELEGNIVSSMGDFTLLEQSFVSQECYERDTWEIFKLVHDITGFDLSTLF